MLYDLGMTNHNHPNCVGPCCDGVDRSRVEPLRSDLETGHFTLEDDDA